MNAEVKKYRLDSAHVQNWALVVQVPDIEAQATKSLVWLKVRITFWLLGMLWKEIWP